MSASAQSKSMAASQVGFTHCFDREVGAPTCATRSPEACVLALPDQTSLPLATSNRDEFSPRPCVVVAPPIGSEIPMPPGFRTGPGKSGDRATQHGGDPRPTPAGRWWLPFLVRSSRGGRPSARHERHLRVFQSSAQFASHHAGVLATIGGTQREGQSCRAAAGSMFRFIRNRLPGSKRCFAA